jgi:squalene-hopene/tetraprenyl-beta-curcumene cyclase
MQQLLHVLAGLLVLTLAAAQDGLPDIKEEVDPSIRWLRSTQDPKTGAYGGGVEGTAWTLKAMAESPRRYTSLDGAFVRDALSYLLARQAASGAIADADATGAARQRQTQLAASALFPLLSEDTKDAYARALRWLGENGVSDPQAGLPSYATDKPDALARATKLLAERKGEPFWDGPAGRVLETARAVCELSAYAKLLAPPKATYEDAQALPAYSAAQAAEVDAAMARGARFLLQAADEGKWGAPGQPDAGLTAMVVGALQSLPEPRPADVQAVIDADLDWLAGLQHEDGSIHQGRLANYTTSAVILALALSSEPAHAAVVARARDYLVALQADEGEGYSEGDRYYGGIGYGGDERPDLSNLQMALEALVASGLDQDHAAFQRSIKFLERCQNRSESNDVRIEGGDVVILPGDDGGAGYMPGDSKAGFEVRVEGGKTVRIPRSYGSMTYAMLKSFVFAGLDKDDERVQACWSWLCKNYTLDVNPGFEHTSDPRAPYQGLFYYFHSMARALNVFGEDVVTDGAGRQHAWRSQLSGRLLAMQSKIDGSWVNLNAPRWWEGNPVLATSYALLALREARPRD